MDWQEWVRVRAPSLGLDVTSGKRTAEQQTRLGGSSASFHLRGTQEAPGAIDVGGPADRLKKLFDEIRAAFAGRINELYLNVPGGTSIGIKDDRYTRTNPEAGRPRHLHIALGGGANLPSPASRIPAENRGERGLDAAPADVCARSVCPPHIKGMVAAALGKEEEPQTNCWCWSDIWVYGIALAAIGGGAVLMTRGGGK